ncbi:hypothetical protein IWW34DRAFT_886724 [Fusarium oxysporum f. sp. albedinis]|nr:hypothetical protein IWW34DRAFT_886724 [Fusarium oxysporum f. sp. albedinis]KAK2469925.1 hypothetical protein H9L39_18740 [Fusarium oxysporum f. sp. albedinis]
MASLLRLPAEIKVLIFQELPSQDLLPIRQACTSFHDWATPLFIDVYFKTRHVMFERRSLKMLLDISRHISFAQHVHTVEFSLYHLLPFEKLMEIEPPFSPYEDMMKRLALGNMGAESLGNTPPPDDYLSRLKPDAYQAQWDDQEELISTGFALDCLTTALSNLTKCKNLAFDDRNRP